MDQQLDAVSGGERWRSHYAGIFSTGPLIDDVHHATLIFQREHGQLVGFTATPCHELRFNGSDDAGYSDFPQVVAGGIGEKGRDGNAVVREKRNSQ